MSYSRVLWMNCILTSDINIANMTLELAYFEVFILDILQFLVMLINWKMNKKELFALLI